MRRRFDQWMQGRYGSDELSRFLLAVCLGILVANMIIRTQTLYYAALLLLGYGYFRMLSRNIMTRSMENRKFLSYTAGIRGKLEKWKRRILQSRDFHIYKCPSCGQKIRIPRGKGKICITCPKCRHEFEKRS